MDESATEPFFVAMGILNFSTTKDVRILSEAISERYLSIALKIKEQDAINTGR